MMVVVDTKIVRRIRAGNEDYKLSSYASQTGQKDVDLTVLESPR